jgi:hypothetical protein
MILGLSSFSFLNTVPESRKVSFVRARVVILFTIYIYLCIFLLSTVPDCRNLSLENTPCSANYNRNVGTVTCSCRELCNVVVRAFYTPISETEETDDISQAPWDSPVLKPPVILPLHQPVILAGEGFAPPGAYTSLLLYARYTRIDIPEGTFTTSTLVKLSVIKPADLSEPEKEGLLAVAMRFYFGSRPSKDILLTMEISQDERRWLPYMNESQPLARTQLAPLLRTPAVISRHDVVAHRTRACVCCG